MFASVPSPPLRISILHISAIEIWTFPVLIFKTVTTQNAAARTPNTRMYLERRLKFSFSIVSPFKKSGEHIQMPT